eukprot:320659_1
MAAKKEPFLPLLQANNKGWNALLFTDSSQISEFRCKSCNNICRDPAELGCDHDDDNDIDLYCKSCLESIILSNNNKCPLNSSHNNPPISLSRRTKKRILKLSVCCPNSLKFKHISKMQKNDNNQINMVYDTNNMDEKEGINMHINDKNDNNCTWIGTLHELITDHIKNCKILSKDFINQSIKNLNDKYDQNIKLIQTLQQQIQNNKHTLQQQSIQLNDNIEQINSFQKKK